MYLRCRKPFSGSADVFMLLSASVLSVSVIPSPMPQPGCGRMASRRVPRDTFTQKPARGCHTTCRLFPCRLFSGAPSFPSGGGGAPRKGQRLRARLKSWSASLTVTYHCPSTLTGLNMNPMVFGVGSSGFSFLKNSMEYFTSLRPSMSKE